MNFELCVMNFEFELNRYWQQNKKYEDQLPLHKQNKRYKRKKTTISETEIHKKLAPIF